MNAAELMIKCLENEGVQYIFGVPGEENEDIMFALADSTIEFVPTRHEQGAAFMADVWGRLSGQAGVCLSTLGPGATNLLTGIADANLDKSPVVAITGQGSLERIHHESHQMIDVIALLEPITKYNTQIRDTQIIPEAVRKAFKTAEQEKPGAAHIELPEDLAHQAVNTDLAPLPKYSVRRPAADPKALSQAIEILQTAKMPLIIAGNGAIRSRCSQSLLKLVEETQIPVATTFMGKGAIPARHDLSIGTVGLGFKDYIIEAFEEADVILSVGYDIAEYDPANWNPKADKKIIHIDFESAEVYQQYIPAVELIGDIASIVSALRSSMSDRYDIWHTPIKERIEQSIKKYALPENSKEYHAPGVLHLLNETLPDEALVISDVGSHKMWIARNYQTQIPNGCIISNGLASMGISLPGGIAASMLYPDRPIVAMMGDGGAMMNIQELETAHRLGVKCMYVIFNDNNYGLIEWKQEMSSGKSFGTKLGNPDFKMLAESFGIKGHRPESVTYLKTILNQYIDSPELCVVELPITTAVNDELTSTLSAYFNQ